ncbi:unnamed protein product [marine sediment metagenome]|uniref:Uncharacterized protein n=1 Tax=marine sediment metagenome TaxID=412755 RepID=X0UQF3_9ZZZZ
MKYKILKEFHSPQFGNCRPGDLLELPDIMAGKLKDCGMVGDLETKPAVEAKIETKPQHTKKATKKAK